MLLATYLAGVCCLWPLRPTGDVLFDRYAQAVRNRQAWRLFTGGDMHPAALPDFQLASWEKDFGNDPRYWELRYFCACARPMHAVCPNNFESDTKPDPSHGPPADFLREAQRRGIARQATLCQLALCEKSEQLPKASDADAEQQAEADRLQRLSAIVAADPRNAAGYYQRALHQLEHGQPEAVTADLEAGNAAPDASWPQLFPLEIVQRFASQGQVAGSAYVSGAVEEGDNVLTDSFAFFELTRDDTDTDYTDLDARSPEGQRRRRAWCGFLCRLALMSNASGRFEARPLLVEQCNALLGKHGSELSEAQRTSVLAALRILNRIREESDITIGQNALGYAALYGAHEWNMCDLLMDMPNNPTSMGQPGWVINAQAFAMYCLPAFRFRANALFQARHAQFDRYFWIPPFTDLSHFDWARLKEPASKVYLFHERGG